MAEAWNSSLFVKKGKNINCPATGNHSNGNEKYKLSGNHSIQQWSTKGKSGLTNILLWDIPCV